MSQHKIKQEIFPVLEMTCAACAVSVESMLKSVTGVKEASVNFANQTAQVTYDEHLTNSEKLQQAVRSIGYDLLVHVEDPQAAQEEAQHQHLQRIKTRTLWSVVLTVPVVIFGMFFMNAWYSNYLTMVLSAPVVFVFGRSFFITAWKQARHGKANMDTLVALSTAIAFFFSVVNTFFPEFWHSRGLHAHVYFETAAAIVVFISIGKLLEEKATSGTSSALKKLIGLQPKTVKIIVEDQIPVSQNSQIEVTTIDLGNAKHNKASGMLQWELTLQPNETKKVVYKFEVKYPKDRIIPALN